MPDLDPLKIFHVENQPKSLSKQLYKLHNLLHLLFNFVLTLSPLAGEGLPAFTEQAHCHYQNGAGPQCAAIVGIIFTMYMFTVVEPINAYFKYAALL